MGLWLHLTNQGYATLYPNHMGLSAEYLFILIGGLGIVIAFFGCCGSFFESRCCLVIVSHQATGLISHSFISQLFLLSSIFNSVCFSCFDPVRNEVHTCVHKCIFCGLNVRNLSAHISSSHPFHCKFCRITFSSEEASTKHNLACTSAP